MRIITLIILTLIFLSCAKHKTELILLGTVHSPVENFNADSLYNIINKIKPDVILYEVDSSFFNKDFTFKKEMTSNEYIATTRYSKNIDVIVRPYDFTGRNEYRINIGSRPTDSKAIKLLDSLYQVGSLNQQQQMVYEIFNSKTKTLDSLAYLGASAFNNSFSDSVAGERQFYQYEKLLRLISEIPLYDSIYHKKPDGDSISYQEGYGLATEFWHLRNKTMALNIQKFMGIFKGKRIIVLNGFFHRYYLNSELRPKQDSLSFELREFYEY